MQSFDRLRKNKGRDLFAPLFFSVIAGIVACMLTALLSSILLTVTELPSFFEPFSLLSLAVGSFVTGILVTRSNREKRFFLTGVLTLVFGCIFLLLRLAFQSAPITMFSGLKLLTVMAPMFLSSFCVPTRKKVKFSKSRSFVG